MLVLAAAARAVHAVVHSGRSADVALSASSGLREHSAVRAVTLGTLRWYGQLEPEIAEVTQHKPLTPLLRSLLITGLHQLRHSRNPPEAVVSSSVDAARELREARAAGLVNAALRRALRETQRLQARFAGDPALLTAHPQWFVEALRAAWPNAWRAVLDANNAHPPMCLRIDLNRTSVADYLARLTQQGLQGHAEPLVPTAVVLERPLSISQLPGFAEGIVSVQDAAAQLACALLQVRPHERVLDACAAPGGKTGALLEAVNGELDLWAVEVDPGRMQRVAENLQRLRRSARLIVADLCAAPDWWDGGKFDRILLDAPCSGTGVIRRHPDIKLLRRPTDIGVLADAAQRILARCLAMLRPGGRLLYCTCSVLPAENDAVIAAALAAAPQARVLPLPGEAPGVNLPPEVLRTAHGLQLLPANAAQTDGFYYACLTVE